MTQPPLAEARIPDDAEVERLESFVLDIDTPADVRAFIARHPVNPIASWLTRQLTGPAS